MMRIFQVLSRRQREMKIARVAAALKLVPLSQPIRNKIRIKRDFLARVFPRFVPVTVVSISYWFIALFMSAVIGLSNYFDFGFVKIALFT